MRERMNEWKLGERGKKRDREEEEKRRLIKKEKETAV